MADELIRPKEKITTAYSRLTTEIQPSLISSMRDFLAELRRETIDALLEEGYERQDIQNVLEAEDFTFRTLSAEQQKEILDVQIPADHIGKETGLSATNIVRKVRERHALQIFDYIRPHDLNVVCELLDSGYPVPDVVATQKKQAFVTKFFKEGTGDLNMYFDSVWNGVNRSRILRAGKRLEACRNAYMEQATSSMIQYKNQDKNKEGFSVFEDGRIVISLLVLHRFDPKVVETVISENSFNPQRSDPNYAKELVAQAMKVKEAYDAIERVKKTSDAKSIGDAFRYYSYHFMEKRGKHLLTPEDEQFILRSMAGNHISSDKIEASYREASPVALEPGRDRSKYLDNSIHKFHSRYEAQKAYSMEQYPKTRELYLDKAKQMEESLAARKYDINKNRSYYDCLIATALLRLNHSSYNIRKVLAECSPQATKDTGNPNKTPDSYASWVVSKARNIIMREQDILYAPKLENKKDMPLSVLIASGVTVTDLYRNAVREIIEGYSNSDRDRMTDPHIDQQACEKLLTKYPDLILDDLAEAVKKASPRSELAGMIQTYPQRIIEAVQVRLKEADQERAFRRSIEAEFNRSRGLEMNGIAEYGGMALFAQSMGHAALEMKRRGIDDVAIRENLLAASEDVSDSTTFVDRILENVRRVSERQQVISEFSPVLDREMTLEEKYKAYAHDILKDVGAYQNGDDIEFVKQQQLSPDFDAEKLNQMLLANSPVAAEPGRDEHYVEFLQERAKERIELENQKLRIYHPEPRQEGKEKDIFKEYEHHRTTLMRNVSLPYDERMDMYIAETLLLQGYPERDVENVLGKSPLAQKNKGHALKGVNMVRDRLDDDIDYQIIIDKSNGKELSVQELTRVRTIENTTTTSSDQ